MVNYSETLDHTFSALSSPIRRGMLARLTRGWATVTELAQPYNVSLPAISKHLQVLEKAGLIERRVKGRVHYCRLLPQPLDEAIEWLDFHRAFWGAQFESLAEFLDDQDQEDSGV
ncbi:MAG TPA: metalloregulator ArsR/SmtB family transcription factor [Anaerolineales bacterium]